jgi:hypothetical protein
VVTATIEIENVLGELGETPYEPMKEGKDEIMSEESIIDRQLHVLNDTLINFFGKGIDGKAGPSSTVSVNINNRCQSCRLGEHTASACLKLADTRPKCAKWGGGHKTDNCGLKCSFCFRLVHMEERCWKKTTKGLLAITNFLEVLVNDEETTLAELNHVCGNDQHVLLGVRIPKRRLPIVANPVEEQEEVITKDEKRGTNLGSETTMKLKILSHFIKGKISLTPMEPMETILVIPGELEYLEGLVKLTRKQKDAEGQKNQVITIHSTPTIWRVSVNKTHHNKTLHLAVEINQAMIAGLVDTKESMSVMAASVVREFGIMHLVAGHETYKTAFGIITQALGRIVELLVKVGGIICQMIFLAVDTDNYDLFLGLDFLIKIGAIVDVEKGVIQVRNEPSTEVEVLPLNVVNMLQLLEGSKEEKCNVQEELFNRKMG